MDDEAETPALSPEERRELEESLRAINARGRASSATDWRAVRPVLGIIVAVLLLLVRLAAVAGSAAPAATLDGARCPAGRATYAAPRWASLVNAFGRTLVCESSETFAMFVTTTDEHATYGVIDRYAAQAGWVEAEPWHAVNESLRHPQTQASFHAGLERLIVSVADQHDGVVVQVFVEPADDGPPQGWFRASFDELGEELCYGYTDPQAGPSARCVPTEGGSQATIAASVRSGEGSIRRLGGVDFDFRVPAPSVVAALGRPGWLDLYQ